jgi:hypothetical protein
MSEALATPLAGPASGEVVSGMKRQAPAEEAAAPVQEEKLWTVRLMWDGGRKDDDAGVYWDLEVRAGAAIYIHSGQDFLRFTLVPAVRPMRRKRTSSHAATGTSSMPPGWTTRSWSVMRYGRKPTFRVLMGMSMKGA